ncbi:ribosome maturation factor RimP [Lactobacillus xylocopicola]|uniref:Ribosome maturation factor RimP n=1 Tax=Lactobacillus xylocopicola TaxID=2976676 RepID=A0ABN6SLW8_9LACO|nr:ribosome maturation factor RimP [Lactobacillus xylocopicola]BDR60628.1 ribosome maturation factor RimP [Lactobacillus xylocopicola]
MAKVADSVLAEISSIVTARNDDLVDAEYVKEKGQNYLRIYVDRENGIDMDEIAGLSELISTKLDAIRPDPFPDPYVLELSSPGIERPLKTAKDWEKALDNYVHVGLYQKLDGEKEYEGTLNSYDDDQIELEIKIKTSRKKLSIPRKLVASIRFAVEF